MKHLKTTILCKPEFREILQAEVFALGATSTEELDEGFAAYWEEGCLFENLKDLKKRYPGTITDIRQEQIREQNWNALWESNFHPIEVEDKLRIRATFHPSREDFTEIVINPKMAFGTGHHHTTYLMLKHLLGMDCRGKRVLDVGCGTGILAIYAALEGAEYVEAFDIDSWAVENSQENALLNKVQIKEWQGTITDLKTSEPFDIVMANITRNILKEEMSDYVDCLKTSGFLLLSGFLEEDLAIIEEQAQKWGLIRKDHFVRGGWVAGKWEKQR